MPARGRELIQRALEEIGYAAPGEAVTAAEEAGAHIIAKRMMDALGAERLAIFQILRTALTLTSGTRDYSIGPGGAFNIARPLWIDAAGFILDTTATDPIETEIEVYTEQAWSLIRQKTFDSGLLDGVYYDRRFDSTNRGLLSTYPTINSSTTQLVIYTPTPTTGFDSLSTQYVFPPGYDELFLYELADRCLLPFGAPSEIAAAVREKRREARDRVFKTNVRVAELRVPPSLWPERESTSEADFTRGWR